VDGRLLDAGSLLLGADAAAFARARGFAADAAAFAFALARGLAADGRLLDAVSLLLGAGAADVALALAFAAFDFAAVCFLFLFPPSGCPSPPS
jgi:hypothetical protein